MDDYFLYFCLGFIGLNIFLILTTISLVYFLENDEKVINNDLMNDMLKLHGSKEGIIKHSNKLANACAMCIIVAIIAINIYGI